jgi:serine/threonine protein kinase
MQFRYSRSNALTHLIKRHKVYHSKRMAHRALKLGNVLVNVGDPSTKSSTVCSMKIADFGLTEIERAEHDHERAELNSWKANVYNFAIMCSEILTGEDPFGDQPRNVMKKLVKAGEHPLLRPNFRSECAEWLNSSIQKCQDGKFHSWPDFHEICGGLQCIKTLLLRGEWRTSIGT